MRISDWSSDVCSSDLGYGDDPAKTFTQAPQNGLILPGMVTQIDDENSVSVEPGAARAVEVRRTELWRLSAAVEARDKKDIGRPEERRVGKECVRTCRSRGSPYPLKKNNYEKAKRTRSSHSQ